MKEYKSEHTWREVCAVSCTEHIQQNALCTPSFWTQDVPRHPSTSSAWGAHTKCPLCRAPGPQVLLCRSTPKVHHPALLADPVGGDILPLRVEPPSQAPAKTVKVMGRALRESVQETWATGPSSPRSLRSRKWSLEQALGGPLPYICTLSPGMRRGVCRTPLRTASRPLAARDTSRC